MDSITDERCPRCGATAVPIVYGLPSAELFDEADAGLVALGGCELVDGAPTWRCKGVDCGLEFGESTLSD